MNPKINKKGFERELANVRAIISRDLKAFVFYFPNRGFIFRKNIPTTYEEMIFDKKIIFIGCYEKPLKSLYLIEDLEHVLNELFKPKKLEKTL